MQLKPWPRLDRIDAICNLGIEGVEAEELLMVLDELGVCASAGSACASGAIEPSHVLVAMGRSKPEAKTPRAALARPHDDEADIDSGPRSPPDGRGAAAGLSRPVRGPAAAGLAGAPAAPVTRLCEN